MKIIIISVLLLATNRITVHCANDDEPGSGLRGFGSSMGQDDELIEANLQLETTEDFWKRFLQSSQPVPYNELRQKSSHNSYARWEGIQDQLQYHRIRSLELDIHRSKFPFSTKTGDWFVYHNNLFDRGTSCFRLSDCLAEFKAWSDMNPNHEPVTVWVDLSDPTMPEGHSPVDLDRQLVASGLDLYSPVNLVRNFPSMQESVLELGWPTDEDLAGKFIFVMTYNNGAYCAANETCNQRLAFRSCSVSPSDITENAFCVFFNQKCEYGSTCQDVYDNGFVCRCYDADDVDTPEEWNQAIFNKVSHIATNQINFHKDAWAKTHNRHGWPYQAIDENDFDVSERQSNDNVIGITVHSGDIWSRNDDFVFAYTREDRSDVWIDYTVAVNNANSHIDEWSKGGIMVREDIGGRGNGANSRYFAVLRSGNRHKLFVQYRSSPGAKTRQIMVDIPPTPGRYSIDEASRSFLRLRVYYNRNSNRSLVVGYGSQDGRTWTFIAQQRFENCRFLYHGLAASSHDDSGNSDGTQVKHLFTNFRGDGQSINSSDLTLIRVGNRVYESQIFESPFPNSIA